MDVFEVTIIKRNSTSDCDYFALSFSGVILRRMTHSVL